jgi:hypothetical protein
MFGVVVTSERVLGVVGLMGIVMRVLRRSI